MSLAGGWTPSDFEPGVTYVQVDLADSPIPVDEINVDGNVETFMVAYSPDGDVWTEYPIVFNKDTVLALPITAQSIRVYPMTLTMVTTVAPPTGVTTGTTTTGAGTTVVPAALTTEAPQQLNMTLQIIACFFLPVTAPATTTAATGTQLTTVTTGVTATTVPTQASTAATTAPCETIDGMSNPLTSNQVSPMYRLT
ncbi:PREDICTED: threonine-rich protein-like [Priapulus caudatus]|uniref:Threonine-rich protein-like n=1 Tax=Priapulus caudatus TaxID=37621 RepID=A0ABM1ENB3_PRICU|nr:PREDICTED: threonine-rich protein-like [Priapulus caudatus]